MLKKIRKFWRTARTNNGLPDTHCRRAWLVLVLVVYANLCLWSQPKTVSLQSAVPSKPFAAFAIEACTTSVRSSDIVNALTKASRTNQKMTRADVERLRRETIGETGEKLSAEM